MHDPKRRLARLKHERGAIAVLAVSMMACCLILFICVVAYGFLQNTRQRLNDTADSLSLAYANQMIMVEKQKWYGTNFDADIIKTSNGFRAADVTTIGLDWPSFNTPSSADRWAPQAVRVLLDTKPPKTGLDGLLNVFLNNKLTHLQAYSTARINQLELGTFTLLPERVVLVLDFSKSMRLYYNNSQADLTAYEVMENTAASVINNFQGYYDMGLLMFSDGTVPSVFTPRQGTGKVISQSQQDTHTNALTQQLAATHTMGDGTDINSAVDLAVQMLDNTNAEGSGANDTEAVSNKRLIMITDGEPDAGPGLSVATNSDYDSRVQAASTLAMGAIERARQAGVMAEVAWMQRTEADSVVGPRAGAFLKSISGTLGNPGDSNDFFGGGAGDPCAINQWLLDRGVAVTCYTPDSIVDLGQNYGVPSYLLPSVFLDTPPRATETFNAYFDLGTGSELVIPSDQVFFDLKAFLAYNQANSDEAILGVGNSFDTTRLTQYPNMLAVCYDPSTLKVWMSSGLCLALNDKSNVNAPNMRLRMRWSAPRIIDFNTMPSR